MATDEAFDLGGDRYVTHGRVKDVGGERVLNKSGSFHGEEGGGIGLASAHESSGARGAGGGGGGGGVGASGSGGYDVGGVGGSTTAGGGVGVGGGGGAAGWKLARSSLPGIGKVGIAPGLHRKGSSNNRLEDLPHLQAVHGGEELGSFKSAAPVGTSPSIRPN